MWFQCIKCERKWTKLIDNGCPVCAFPCQVFENTQRLHSIEEEDDDDDNVYGHSGLYRQGGGMPFTSTGDYVFDLPNSTQHWSSSEQQREDVVSEEDDVAAMKRELTEPSSDVTPRSIEQIISREDRAYFSSNEVSDIEAQSATPPPPHESDTVVSTQSSHTLSSNEDNCSMRKESIKKSVQKVHLTPPTEQVNGRPDLTPTIREQSTAKNGSVKKNKRRAKKSKKKEKKKGFDPPAPRAKIVAQLELPDPIPKPVPPKQGNEWSNVLRKEVNKADKRMLQNTSGRINAREMINAGSYPSRTNKDEDHSRDRAVLDIRFNIGGAKHDMRRIVPRSLLE